MVLPFGKPTTYRFWMRCLLTHGVSGPMKCFEQHVLAIELEVVDGTKEKMLHDNKFELFLLVVPTSCHSLLAVEPPMVSDAFVAFLCPSLGAEH